MTVITWWYIENWRDSERIIVGNYNKGKYEGREEGIETGEANKEQYAAEKVKQKAVEMAERCKQKGMPLPDIAELTGLTEDEIKSMES